MPKAMLAKFAEQHATNVHKGAMITPSALKGCRRKLVLERLTDYYAKPPKLYYAVRGSLIHGFLENHGLPDVQTEVRLYKKIVVNGEEFVLSGQIDFYDAIEESIEDYKTASDKAFWFLFESGAKDEHIAQTNVYRYLCDGGHVGSLDGPQVFWPVKKIVVHYVLMNQVISTGRIHSERINSYKAPKKYKLEKDRDVVGHTHRGTPIWELKIDIPAVPLWDDSKVLKHVTDEGFAAARSFKEKQSGRMPNGVLYDLNGDAWQCGYCDVQDACHAYEKQFNNDKFIKLHTVESE